MSFESSPRFLPSSAFWRYASGLAATLFCLHQNAQAVIVNGRFSAGGYLSREDFSDSSNGPASNDFSTFSTRFYLGLQKLGKFNAAFDLRDTHDFFDKLDAERLQLTGANSFQVREAYFKYPNQGKSFYSSLGRFSLLEAGAVYVDGVEVGDRVNNAFRLGAFGGHNPRRPQDTYMRTDTPDMEYGAYVNYQNPNGTWKRFFNTSASYVTNQVNGFTDRRYLFSNALYQWNSVSRVITNIYLDFVPRTYVQNGLVVYQQGVTPRFDTTMQLTAYDAISYARQRSVLETLPSSPYRDASLQARYRFGRNSAWLNEFRFGERLADNKNRVDAKSGFRLADMASGKMDVLFYAGYTQEFISRGPMARFEANSYSRKWEYGVALNGSMQKRFDDAPNSVRMLHKITAQINLAHVFSNSLFSTLSLQYDHDEVVSIISGFFNLTYRFGSQNLAPIRDGAPPRRSL